MNTELRKNAKNEFEKDFYKLKINSIYGKTIQNDRKHRDIRLVTIEAKRNKFASEPNYHSTKCISKILLVMETKKTEVKMNKPIYLGQAILDLSKTLMYEFSYDYLKPMYGDKIRLCYTDTDICFIMHIKTDDFYKDISADVDRWFDTSNFNKNDNRSLEIGKNKKVLGKFKDELGGKIMTKFCVLRAKTYSFLIDEFTDDDYEKNNIVNKKAKGTKKCVIKREILFYNYIDSLFKNKVLYRTQQRFRSDHHKVYTEEDNKIALSSNDDKRIQTFDNVITYPYGTNAFMVCRNEMLLKNKFIDSDMINSESQLLRDKSQVLRKESQAFRTNSLLLRNELKELREASRDIKNKSYILRTESQMLKNKYNESQLLRDKSQVLRKESKALRTNSLLPRNELKELRPDSHDIKNKSYILRTESRMLRNKSNESQSLRDQSQVLRKESQALRTN